MLVLHLAAECAPVAKVGGLGDVVGALPSALHQVGVRSAVLLPLYGGPDGAVAGRAGALALVSQGEAHYGGARSPYSVYRSEALGPDVPLYLLHEPVHFGSDGVYVDADGGGFSNAQTRFPMFQACALDWLVRGDGAPTPDVLHLHDHHTGLVPVLIRYGPDYGPLRTTPTVFTIHSADHQGEYPWQVWEGFGVHPPESEGLLVEDELNSMKAALRWADAVTTVSPTYAHELTVDDVMAGGLAEAFRQARGKTTGILNGVDYGVWTPTADPHLAATYSAADLTGKAICKRDVCEAMGLDPDRPLLVFVGRLMPEKGADILAEALERIVRKTGAAVAVLGTGYPEHEAQIRGLNALLRSDGLDDRFGCSIAFDNALAHRLYAAADVFLMPSQSEPCGLGQMYAMAYGAPPVVHAVGGLVDTVTPWDGASGTGFLFDPFTADAFAAAAAEAVVAFADREGWARLVQNAMATDFSWGRSAGLYRQIFERLAEAA